MKTKNIIITLVILLMGVANNINAQVDFGALYPNETMPKHGFFNPQLKALAGVSQDGFMAGIAAGMRLGNYLRIEWNGVFVKNVNDGHHQTMGSVIYDIVPGQSDFYQKTGLDFNLRASAGWVNQASHLEFAVENDYGEVEGALLKRRMKFAAGGGVGMTWNPARHWQLGVTVMAINMPTEKKFKNAKDELIKYYELSEEDVARVNRNKYLEWDMQVSFEIRYCF